MTPGLARRSGLGVAISLLLVGCGGQVSVTSDGGGGRGDAPRKEQGTKPGDAAHLFDLPTQAGVPCLYGQCGANLICMANVCHTMCPLPTDNCNDIAAGCAADETCLTASSFNGFCVTATGNAGDRCSDGVYCKPKTLCVKVGSSNPKCYPLCKYGCSGQCGTTSNGCRVCYQ